MTRKAIVGGGVCTARSVVAALLLAVAGGAPAAAATYVLGGIVGAISGDSSYGWDGSENTTFRAAIQNAANFGPSGTVGTAVSTVNITDTGNLSGIQGLVIPWWYNTSASTTQVNQVYAFFTSGGDLLLGDDDSTNDPVGIKLGLLTQDNAGNGWTVLGALSTGPFGPVTSIVNSGDYGYFLSSSVTTLGGTVGSHDSSNDVTSAYWPRGTFCSTCGALVIIGDVDTWTIETATYSPLNSNGRFALNAVAYLVQNSGNHTGGLPTTPVPPSIWLTLVGLACAGFFFGYRSRHAAV